MNAWSRRTTAALFTVLLALPGCGDDGDDDDGTPDPHASHGDRHTPGTSTKIWARNAGLLVDDVLERVAD